jgi:peptidyl-prolyl cis-trans isomerase SurA
MMPRQIANAVRDLEPGDVSEPLLGNSSIVLVRVNDRRPRSEVIVREFRARHILVSPSELVSAEDARELVEDLHQQIEDGAEFAALAREFSDDERSANLGGLMDWFPENAYGRTIQAVCSSLDPGEVSQPFQTGEGWHIVKLLDTRQSDRTQEALRAEAREMIRQQRADEELERVLRQMRDESYVEVML